MILNPYSITYLLLSALSLLLGIAALVAGIGVARAWQTCDSPERRYQLEKNVYLSMTLIALGFCLRLVLVPLWFLMLQSLIPSIPGAMCLCGVHLLKPSYSFLSTLLKFILPMVYGYWLALNALDRKIETQPLMTRKLYTLIPLNLLMFVESFSDLHFLTAVKPRFVNCCSSLFDDSSSKLMQTMTYSGWAWVFVFFAMAGASLIVAGYVLRRPRHPIGALLGVLGPVTLISFVLAVHTALSPRFLQAQFHHCVFCVWQKLPDLIAVTAAICLACWASVIYAATRSVLEYPGASVIADANARRLLQWVMGSLLVGCGLLAARIAAVNGLFGMGH